MKTIKIVGWALLICLASCSPITSEMWFESNGSGRLLTTIQMDDMGSFMQGMGAMFADSTGTSALDTTFNIDEKIDTSITLAQAMPDSVKELLPTLEGLDKILIQMNSNPETQEFSFGIDINYESQKELDEIKKTLENVSEAQKQNNGGGLGGDMSSTMMTDYNIDYEKGIITLPGMDMAKEMGQDSSMAMFMPMLDSLEYMEDDSPEKMMLEMMFNIELNTIVHAPGKILEVNDESGKIEGNTVTFNDTLLELMKKGDMGDRVIKYKK